MPDKIEPRVSTTQSNNFIAFLFIFLFLTIIYYPTLAFTYFYHDDMILLGRLAGHYPENLIQGLNIYLGRYLGAFLMTLFSWIVYTPADLAWVRLFNIGIYALSAYVIFLILRQRFAYLVAILFATLIFTLPAFQVAIAWAGIGYQTPALLCAILSAYLANKTISESNAGRAWRLKGLSAILLASSAAFYQSSAMAYWPAMFLILLVSQENLSALIRRAKGIALIGVSGLILYWVIISALRKFIPAQDFRDYTPYVYSLDILGKLNWFIQEPLVNALNLWNIFPNRFLTWLVPGFLFITIFFKLQEADKSRARVESVQRVLFFLMLAIVLFPLSFLPNLITIKSVSFYRCLTALSFLLLSLVVLSICFWVNRLCHREKATIQSLVMAGFFLFGASEAMNTVLTYRVWPSYAETHFIKREVDNALAVGASHIHIIHPRWDFDHAGRYDEFLTPTTAWNSIAPELLVVVIKDLNNTVGAKIDTIVFKNNYIINQYHIINLNKKTSFWLTLEITSGFADQPIPCDGCYVIDAAEFLTKNGESNHE